MKQIQLSLETAKQMYESGIDSLKQLALENYPELNDKQLKWEDYGKLDIYCDIKQYNKAEAYNANKNTLPSKEYCKAMLALCQLIMWREKVNNGWIPVIGKMKVIKTL